MNRQFKFRIWDKQDKRFVNNDCGTHCCSNWHLDAFGGGPVDFVNTLGDEPYQFTAQEPCDYWMDGMRLVKGPRYIVSQLVMDGIYEGDFIEVTDAKFPDNYAIGEVVYMHDSFVCVERSGRISAIAGPETFVDVLGNVFENPELLKQ